MLLPFAIDALAGVTAMDTTTDPGGPNETSKLTAEPTAITVPGAGFCVVTWPAGTVLLAAEVTLPTVSPALTMAVAAALCVMPTTFGTV